MKRNYFQSLKKLIDTSPSPINPTEMKEENIVQRVTREYMKKEAKLIERTIIFSMNRLERFLYRIGLHKPILWFSGYEIIITPAETRISKKGKILLIIPSPH